VVINYNKLHADPKSGKNLDIILKKLKHQMVENMSRYLIGRYLLV
jgi:hypothetical protein